MALAWYAATDTMKKAGVDARMSEQEPCVSGAVLARWSSSHIIFSAYIHGFCQYYNRWANHEQSAKLSRDLYVKTEKKMEDMQITSSLTWIEVQFMKKAVEEVDKCRMTLKWTYSMAYYLAKSNEKRLV